MATNLSLRWVLIIIFLPILVRAQKGSIISFGASNISFNEEVEFPLSSSSTKSVYLAYEALPTESFAAKLQGTYGVSNDNFKYWDVGISLSYLMKLKRITQENQGTRLSFPIMITIFYWDLDDSLTNRYGSFGLAGQGGIRYYLTYKLALEGYFGYYFNHINKVNEDSFSESIGTIKNTRLSIGISYFIN